MTNAHYNTCIHPLAAITVTMRLAQAQTHTLTHACIASQQSQRACAQGTHTHTCIASQQSQSPCALCTRTHTRKHTHASRHSNHSEHAQIRISIPTCNACTHTHAWIHTHLALVHIHTYIITRTHTLTARLRAFRHADDGYVGSLRILSSAILIAVKNNAPSVTTSRRYFFRVFKTISIINGANSCADTGEGFSFCCFMYMHIILCYVYAHEYVRVWVNKHCSAFDSDTEID